VARVATRHLARLRVVCEPAAVALQSERGVGVFCHLLKGFRPATPKDVECLDVRPGDLEGPDAVRRENFFLWRLLLLLRLGVHHMDDERPQQDLVALI